MTRELLSMRFGWIGLAVEEISRKIEELPICATSKKMTCAGTSMFRVSDGSRRLDPGRWTWLDVQLTSIYWILKKSPNDPRYSNPSRRILYDNLSRLISVVVYLRRIKCQESDSFGRGGMKQSVVLSLLLRCLLIISLLSFRFFLFTNLSD